ncbi:sugar transferase [Phycisphaeraceae bacterium D3-23]
MLGRFLLHRRRRRVPKLTSHVAKRSAQLNRMLERERARADRSGHELSLLLLGLDGRKSKSADLEKLIEVIEHRCRITDDVGEFDRHTAFILLPDTVSQGARHFAESIQAVMQRHDVKTSYGIYSYAPANASKRKPPSDGDSGSGGGRRFDETPAPVARRIPDDQSPRPSISVAAKALAKPAYELETVMTRALPRWKRAVDLGVAGTMLLALWPLMVAIGIAIKIESRGPAMFRQRRAGLGGRPFWINKFRTMVDGAERHRDNLLHINEQDGPAFKIKNDPRITRFGALLRKTSLDELPQLVNVLLGEMTLVGPRPLPCHESDVCEGWQRRRLDVTPGLTCIWQISGRSTVSFDDWVRMDLAYQKRLTFWHDARILLATVPAVLSQRGAQ